MNPFKEKPITIKDSILDWPSLYPTPYKKLAIDPYTKLRILLMNGIEMDAVMFKHQFHRACQINELRCELSLLRCIEQQQKHINWLKPLDETLLETTIGYEHLGLS